MEPLTCPKCHTPFRPSDLNAALGVATCGACALVYRLDGKPAASGEAPRSTEPRRIPLPERFQVSEEPGSLTVRWRWFSPATLFVLLFAGCWDAFLFFWYGIALSSPGPGTAFLLFPLIHVAVGVGMTYWALCGLINATVVTVDHGQLTISHGPLPWPGSGVWQRDDLAQLFADERVTRSRNGGTSSSFRLNAVLRDGRLKPLLSGLTDRYQAQWLEQAIEGRLRIVDRPVPGELPKA